LKNEHHIAASDTDSADGFCASGDHGHQDYSSRAAQAATCQVFQSPGNCHDGRAKTPSFNASASSDDSDDSPTGSAGTTSTDQIAPPCAVATPQAPTPNPVLNPAPDSGVQGDDTPNVPMPAITGSPTVTDTLAADGVTVTGTSDPNASVTIANGTQTIGTAQADANGAWSFDTTTLTPGPYSLVASETNSAGNTGSAPPLAVTVPARFNVTDVVTANQTLLHGSDYPGPVDYLQAGYNYTGTDNSVISALVGSVFMHADSSGENAEVALSGNNVLASGSSSSWLVGASGADGGNDTFFLSDQGNQQTWDTLVNFHVGDMLTLWDFNPTKGSTTSLGLQGADKAQGDTIAVDFGNGSNSSTLVTFAGLPTSAQFSTTTGSTGGHDYMMMTRTA